MNNQDMDDRATLAAESGDYALHAELSTPPPNIEWFVDERFINERIDSHWLLGLGAEAAYSAAIADRRDPAFASRRAEIRAAISRDVGALPTTSQP